jgi:hypothetical protein
MKKGYFRFYILCSLLFTTNYLLAQTGKQFWFVAPEASSGHRDRPVALRISSLDTAANVTISMPASAAAFNGGSPINVSLAPNSATSVNLTSEINLLETKPSNTILNNGLLVTSDRLISVYYDVDVPNAPTQPLNGEIFALKGESALGTEFYTPFQTFWNNGPYTPTPYSSFDIVATEDNTNILIYPKTAIVGHPALQKFSITLNRGQTWSGANPTKLGTNNPSGSIILSDKPIAVTVKTDSDAEGICRDLCGDQIVPTDIIGKEYIVIKGSVNNESAFIVATQNNTVITVNGVYETTLFGSETYRIPITDQYTYIQASKPVYTVHYSGFGCELGSAILPPLNCAGSSRVSFVRGTAEYFALNLLVKNGNQDKFVLNGSNTAIAASSFTPVPGTGGEWVAAILPFNTTVIPVGNSNNITNTGAIFAMGLINGGSTTTCRYGYFSEFKAIINVKAGPDQLVCKNNTVKLNGSVSGGTITGEWTTNGSGTFVPNNTTFNATYIPSISDLAIGSLDFTLTSTGLCFPVTDQMKVTFTPAPTIDAGNPITVCANNSNVSLNAAVTIVAGGIWTGGSGIFTPNNTSLITTYTPSIAEVSAGKAKLIITSTGNGDCIAVKDSIDITITPAPTVNAGTDQNKCSNNANTALNGSFTTSTGAIWSGGAGTYSPSSTVMNSVYTPTSGEISSGVLILTLTTTGNGQCNAASDQMRINFNQAPVVSTSGNQILCGNNARASITASISSPATGGIWSGGIGTFSPSNTSLNVTYTPTASEILAGSTNLILTSTGNGNCLAETNNLVLSYSSSPTVNAGADRTVCANNANVILNGQILSVATGGIWSGGNGVFSPNNTTLNATYTPSASEIAAGTVSLTLTSTGNGSCNPVSDQMIITITPAPVVNAGSDLTSCVNNSTVSLAGFVQNVGGSVWSGGAGVFSPSTSVLNATYTPTNAELIAGEVNLTLSSVGNGNCNAVSDVVRIVYNPAPEANAGIDRSFCSNNASITLNGAVNRASGGVWSGGLGTFTPNNSNLQAVYNPTNAEILSGSLTLTLTTTGNGQCNAVTDNVVFTFTSKPEVNAGIDQTVCANNATIGLVGTVTVASGGVWSSVGGGVFTPNPSSLTVSYIPTAAEISSGKFKLRLTSSGNNNCNPEFDELDVTVTPSPIVNAGADIIVCANKSEAALQGQVQNAGGGSWTGGAGIFSPSNSVLNPTYLPTSGEITAGSITLTLTSTNNGNCNAVSDQINIVINQSPEVNAGSDLTLCANNSKATLPGSVIRATGAQWTGGLGTFSPSNNSLLLEYTPTNTEIASGGITLTLTSTGNGVCNAVADQVRINFTASPEVNTGFDQTVCANNSNVSLAAQISVATGGLWSGGSGSFNPGNNVLNTVYTPSPQDILNGKVTLTLTSTGNGNCVSVTDNLVITITPAPVVNAGIDLVSCVNNPSVNLNGSVSNARGVIWSGGSGIFNSSASINNPTYIPSNTEINAGFVILTLTSTGNDNCLPVSDELKITINPAPTVNAGSDVVFCANNSEVSLNGSITLATGGLWSGGLGVFKQGASSLSNVYVPTQNEINAGSLQLTLTSTNNANCNPVSDNLLITFTVAPSVSAGSKQSLCANNELVNLNGSVNIASGAIWSGGAGVFTPNNTTLNATYQPTNQEIQSGLITLTLTSTGNGLCKAEAANLEIAYTPAPFVNAGADQTLCVNNLDAALSGFVSGKTTTGRWTSSGNGVFVPNPNVLNATYRASAADSLNGGAKIFLTSTNNGNCKQVVDTLDIFILPAGIANAGSDRSVCANNANVTLTGLISGGATSGSWSSDGTGTFLPDNKSLNATYVPSRADTAIGSVKISLKANSCNEAVDDLIITITPAPSVNAGIDQIVCLNNLNIQLLGSIKGGASSGIWSSSGTGTFSPNNTSINPIYQASKADSINTEVNIILTSSNNGNCLAVRDTMKIRITTSGTANAGEDQILCINNSDVQLNASVGGGADAGVWSSSGTGVFLPSKTSLNATYTPSASDLIIGNVILQLTGNSCDLVKDELKVNFSPAPSVNAGSDKIVCANKSEIDLAALINGASGINWTSTGSGTFLAGNQALSNTYRPSAFDISNQIVFLFASTTGNGNCKPVTDTVKINITPKPVVNAGSDQNICASALQTLLVANVLPNSKGKWTTQGTGSFFPSDTLLTTSYIFSKADSILGKVKLILTSTENGICNAEQDEITIALGNTVFADAGKDIDICESQKSIELSGLITGGTNTGNWTSLGSGNFSPNSSILKTNYVISKADSTNGSVKLILTSTNNGNCEAGIDTIQIFLKAKPSIDAGKDLSVCKGAKSVLLSATSSAKQVLWTTRGTGFYFPTSNTLNTEYFFSKADSASGRVSLIISSTNDICIVSDSLRISFGGSNTVDVGSDKIVCSGTDGIQLRGIVSGTTKSGRWTKLDGTGAFLPSDTSLGAIYVYTPSDSLKGFVSLLLSSTNNGICLPGRDTLKITFGKVPSIDLGTDRAICRGENTIKVNPQIANLNGIKWFTKGSGIFFPNDSVFSPTYEIGKLDSTAGEVEIIAVSNDQNACKQVKDSLIVIVKNPIEPGFILSNLCAKQKIVFTDTSKTLVGSIKTRFWDFGDNSFSSLQQPSHIFERDKSYQVKLIIESNLGCKDSIIQNVSLKPSPIANFSYNELQAVVNKEINFVDLSKDAQAWNWNFGDNFDTIKIQNPLYTYRTVNSFDISLVVSNAFQCLDTIVKKIEIKEAIVLPPQLPNAFSPTENPNASGVNDVFYPRGGPFQKFNYEFRVYNLWGELVFESNDPDLGWNGLYKNKLQPVGSYIYTLKAKTTDGKEYIRTGDVSIIR